MKKRLLKILLCIIFVSGIVMKLESPAAESKVVEAATYSGFVMQNGYLFYFDPATGEKLTGLQTIAGKTYYFYPGSGAALGGLQKINGKTYYFNPTTFVMKTGIVEVDYNGTERTHYFLDEGGMASGWVSDAGKTYYFSSAETGAIMLTGVQSIDGKLYYFDTTTGERKEGIYSNNQGKYYYYTTEGTVKMGLQEWNGELYFLKESKSGEVQYGMQYVDGALYYFHETTGAARKNCTVKLGNVSFTIGSDGKVSYYETAKGYEDSLRAELILNGLQKLGTPYDFDKTKGFACGSFVQYVYSTIGIELPTASHEQAKAIVQEQTIGKEITEEQLKPGDLVFWDLKSCDVEDCEHWNEIHHVGIYLGKGKMLEASEPRGGVVVQDIHSYDQFQIQYYASLIEQADPVLEIPNPVTDLKAVSAGKKKVKLTWTESAGAEGYLIYGQKNGKYGYVGMTGAGTSYTDSKALDADYNFYWVFPYIEDGCGNMIPGGCTKYVYAKGVLPAVINLKASSVKGAVKLTWSSCTGADGYLIYGIRPGGKYEYIGMRTGVSSVTFSDTKASKTEYNFYWVYPFHHSVVNDQTKMIVGGTAKYTYGRAL